MRALAQSSLVQKGASGSSETARSMSSSVSARTLSQSVLSFILASCSLETRVIRSPFISVCPPGADDPAALTTPRINHVQHFALDCSVGAKARFTVILPIVLDLKLVAVENLRGRDKVDAVLEDVRRRASPGPIRSPSSIITNV